MWRSMSNILLLVSSSPSFVASSSLSRDGERANPFINHVIKLFPSSVSCYVISRHPKRRRAWSEAKKSRPPGILGFPCFLWERHGSWILWDSERKLDFGLGIQRWMTSCKGRLGRLGYPWKYKKYSSALTYNIPRAHSMTAHSICLAIDHLISRSP